MAWYRCGGGGLPAGLQSDMDTVLNKKLGTSTTYPPTDWPDTVNLMGPLPEKTASGAIANITDGADGVPVKNWLVTLPASLDGYTEVNGVKTGKNLLLLNDGTYTIGNTGATVTILNGEISVTGTTTNSGGRTTRLSDYFVLHAGTYYISPVISASPYVRSYLNKKSDNTVVGYSSGYSFTVSEDTEVYFGINIEGGKTYNTTLSPQLEVGTTAHTYEPYKPPTTYTVSLGRTIHGGTADIVTGEGEDENGNTFTFTPITPTPETALGTNNFWADEGDSDVTYRADISLALQALGGGGRGLMMMRPTEPEETEETEETEGLEDELNR